MWIVSALLVVVASGFALAPLGFIDCFLYYQRQSPAYLPGSTSGSERT